MKSNFLKEKKEKKNKAKNTYKKVINIKFK